MDATEAKTTSGAPGGPQPGSQAASGESADQGGRSRGKAVNLRFRGDIEGLRGVAIGIGVVGHLYEDYGTTQAAHTIPAMDIFFAMSGFLITSLLVKEYRESSRKPDKRTISLTRFYERRARRILPAALVVNAAILIGAWLIFNKVRFAETQQHAYWSAIWGENFHLINESADYFSLQQVKSPFQHYWSLAVEEQFYLFWPAVFLLAVKAATWKRIPFIRGDWRRSLLIVTAAIAIPSFIVSVVSSYANPAAAYFSTFNRAWIILIGAAAAIAPQLRHGLGQRTSKAASWAGAALIVAGVAVVGYGDPYPGFLGLFAAVGTTLLMVAGMRGEARTPVTAFLDSRPVRFTGRISYSLYLWHWPIIVFADVLIPEEVLGGYWRFAVLGIVSYLVGWWSAVFIELPFHQVKNLKKEVWHPRRHWIGNPRQRTQVAAMAFVAVATIGLIGNWARRFPATNEVVAATYRPPDMDWQLAMGQGFTRSADIEVEGTAQAATPPAPRSSGAGDMGRSAWLRQLRLAAGKSNTTSVAIALAQQGQALTPDPGCRNIKNTSDASACSIAGSGLGGTTWPAADQKRNVVLIGNSIASQWRSTLASVLPKESRLYPVTMSSCDPSRPASDNWIAPSGEDCGKHVRAVDEMIQQLRPGMVVIAAAGTMSGRASVEWSKMLSRYEVLVRRMQRVAPRVLVIGPSPPLAPYAECLPNSGTDISECNRQLYAPLVSTDAAVTRRMEGTGATYLSGVTMTCVEDKCPAFVAGRPVRFDSYHFTRTTVYALRGFLQQAVARSLAD